MFTCLLAQKGNSRPLLMFMTSRFIVTMEFFFLGTLAVVCDSVQSVLLLIFADSTGRSAIDRCRVTLICNAILLGIPLCCAAVHGAGIFVSSESTLRPFGWCQDVATNLTFFCVHCKSCCVSFAARMPSAKLLRVFARRARA